MLEKLIVVVFVVALLRAAFNALSGVVRVAGAVLGGYIMVHWLARGSWGILALLYNLVGLAVILFIVGSISGSRKASR